MNLEDISDNLTLFYSTSKQVDALRVSPAVTRLTVYRRRQVLMTFLVFSQKLHVRFRNPIFLQKKYVMRKCHLKDFEICRQNSEKRWEIDRSLGVKNDIFFENF